MLIQGSTNCPFYIPLKGPQRSPFLHCLSQLQCESTPLSSVLHWVWWASMGPPTLLIKALWTPLTPQAMPRLRVGIGRPSHPDMVQAHVLGCFSAAEQELLPPLLERAADLLLDHIRERSQGPPPGFAITGHEPA